MDQVNEEKKPVEFRCPICDTTSIPRNVDEFRHKPHGMAMCETCGFVSFPQIVADMVGLKEYYREEYRDAPSVQNLYAGQRKLNYHGAFLGDLFRKWKTDGKAAPVVGEIGAAFGMFLGWVKQHFKSAEVSGTELTLTYRRNAWHEYGIFLSEDFDDKKQYDLIASYKVAEHQPNVDKELRRYVLALKPDGHIYISVPIWFGVMNNFGKSGFELEYYYHKNHINVWTRTHFETLLRKVGLRIVKQDHAMYDSTYLCVRDDEMMKEEPKYESPAQVLQWLEAVKKASVAFDQGDFAGAIRAWPNFPDAHVGNYEANRAAMHKKGFEVIKAEVLAPALTACPDSPHITLFAADLHMRYGLWEEALKWLEKSVGLRPNDPAALMNLSQVYRQMANAATDPKEKARLFTESREVARYVMTVSEQMRPEAKTWVFNDNARIPMPSELEKTDFDDQQSGV
jgi:SAM-dependent methyltransferase